VTGSNEETDEPLLGRRSASRANAAQPRGVSGLIGAAVRHAQLEPQNSFHRLLCLPSVGTTMLRWLAETPFDR